MTYAEIETNLKQSVDLKGYIYKHYGEIYKQICQVIESIPDNELEKIYNSGDIIRAIEVVRDRNDCFEITFSSDLSNEVYYVYVPAENRDFLENINEDRVNILLQRDAIEIYSEVFTLLKTPCSSEKLKAVLGEYYIHSEEHILIIKKEFFSN